MKKTLLFNLLHKLAYCLALVALVVSFHSCQKKDTFFSVNAPDGNILVKITNQKGRIAYTLSNNDNVLIKTSMIAILPNEQAQINSAVSNSENETWKPVWGQFSEIKNQYNELVLDVKLGEVNAMLYVRVFNEGIGFRYEVEGFKEGTEAYFYCEYNLSSTDALYCAAGEREPLGPFLINDMGGFENQPKLKMPIVIEKSEQSHLSLLESDLYAAPEFGVIKFKYDSDKKILVAANKTKLTGEKVTTPWRVILVNESIGDLVTNTTPLNLATPNKIKDPSWINPGKSLWDWRVHGYQTDDGFTYGIDTASYIRFIDFAKEKKIKYFLIDAHWYSKVTKGHFEISDNLDIQKVSSYAKENGVQLLLYYDRKKGYFGDDQLFPYFESLGMSGIKYGFMGQNVSFTKAAIQKSAENHLLIDFHDSPVPFTGIQRTFPNAITNEYCHAQQDSRRAFTPESFIKMALINAIQGPLDMNNGNFDLIGINKGDRKKGPIRKNTYFSTVVSETARTLIIFSGLVCLPDAPEAYNKKSDLFEFIEKMPVGKWDESKILGSEMGEYISTARRFNEQWFVGSVTHKKVKDHQIVLDFLKEGTSYKVTYYEDTEETHGSKNPEAYQVRTGKVVKGDVVKVTMAAGGGHCMWIRPEK